MTTVSSNRISRELLPRVGTREFFDLQTQFKKRLFNYYGDRHSRSEIERHAVEGPIKLFDALALRDCLASLRPLRILEIGSFLGFSLRWILDCTASFSARVTSLDPRVRHRIFDDIKSFVVDFSSDHGHRVDFIDACLAQKNEEMFLYDYLNYEPKIGLVEARRLLRDIPTVVEPFDNFDFAFVDGDHSYGATIANVSLVARMMPLGGYILVHDAISWPEVRPALEGLASSVTGLQMVEVLGDDIHRWYGQHRSLRMPKRWISSSLCDGLALIRIEPDASIKLELVRQLIQRPAQLAQRKSLFRRFRLLIHDRCGF